MCETEVVVVRCIDAAAELRCGGHAMVPVDAARPPGLEPSASHRNGSRIGKRYTDEDGVVEVLCTKSGEGSLSLGDAPLRPKEAKPLPSSD